ncbi:hypothetical protein [Ascidiimonas sp. W6]|uniref:hypothetical protein n=1 Tax=Ascidiimonas meishanensis TaxID=3128903 RepID=UPI0030EC5067
MITNTQFLLLFFLLSLPLWSVAQDTIPSSNEENKNAIIYIVRTSPMASAINFRFFVDGNYVGKFHHNGYLKLYVSPGRHVISAKAENLFVMEAQLEPGKVYAIDAAVQMGAFYAAVQLVPVKVERERHFTRVQKRLAKSSRKTFNNDELKKKTLEYTEIIKKASHKYYKKKKKGKDIPVLSEAIDEELLLSYRTKS